MASNGNVTVPKMSRLIVFVHDSYFVAICNLLFVLIVLLTDDIHLIMRHSRCYNVAEATSLFVTSVGPGMLGNGNRHSDWNRNANRSTDNWDGNYLTGVGGNRNRSTNCIAARLQFSLG